MKTKVVSSIQAAILQAELKDGMDDVKDLMIAAGIIK